MQTRLLLPVVSSTTLVTVDTARAALGFDAETVAGMCESGKLVAYDLSSGTARREIRIWADSIRAHIDGSRLPQDEMDRLQIIIGHEVCEWIPTTQLAQRVCVHRRQVYRWVEDGDLVAHQVDNKWRVLRASLFPFLKGRLIR
jgi:excisionase family DNA binding protein